MLSVTIVISGGLFANRESAQATAVDQEYVEQLKAAGFPDSYVEPLAALHKSYPKWQFEAVNTGLDWNTVIEKESKNGVNLVPKNGDDSTKSTASGAYDWFTNTWTIYDGSAWVGANEAYIAKYMDPRNFLNETDIFQFESLSYNSSQSRDGVASIVKGTFMETPVTDTDGSELDYIEAFLEIGRDTGVSPYHLASRVRQEQGLRGTSSLISGTYANYEGYFNYFNFGAAGVTSSLVIQNGLAFAKNKGWDSRYKSLFGGAELLSKNYIAVGQDTLYFQKFNVVNSKNLYGHQYMANLTAAYTEGRKLGQGYSDKQQAFVFRIPIYNSMPKEAVTFSATGNPNNYLKSLTVTGQSLTPSFRGSVTSYSLVVEDAVETVTISAAAVASTSTVTGVGTVKLKTGTNTVNVKCKSQSGVTKTYTLTIVRKEGETADIIPSSTVYQIGEDSITGIQPKTKASAFLKNIKTENATMKLVGADGKENTGVVATGNSLEVYDQNGKKISSYTIVIYGDVNGDGAIDVLDMIKVNRHILNINKITDCYLEAGNANRQNDGVNVLDLIYINRHVLGIQTIQQ